MRMLMVTRREYHIKTAEIIKTDIIVSCADVVVGNITFYHFC